MIGSASSIYATFRRGQDDRLFGLAFFALLLLPLALIFTRAGAELCTGLIGICFLAHSYRHRQWGWLRTPLASITCLAWLWLSLVVTPLALSPAAGVAYTLLWFRLPLLYFAVTIWLLREEQERKSVAWITGGLLIVVALDTYWQFLTGVSILGYERLDSGRLTGPFSGPRVGHYLAFLLVPVATMLMVFALQARHRRGAMATMAVAAILFAVIVLSGERAAAIGVLMAFSLALGLMTLVEPTWRNVGIGIGFLVAGMMAALYFTSPWVQERFGDLFFALRHYPKSDYGLLFFAALDIGSEHWAHGVGVRGFREVCPPLDYYGTFFRGMHPHNAYLEWFSEAGAIGLALFVAILAALTNQAWRAFRNASGVARLAGAVALGQLCQQFFPLIGMQSSFTNWPAILQWLSLALMVSVVPINANKLTK